MPGVRVPGNSFRSAGASRASGAGRESERLSPRGPSLVFTACGLIRSRLLGEPRSSERKTIVVCRAAVGVFAGPKWLPAMDRQCSGTSTRRPCSGLVVDVSHSELVLERVQNGPALTRMRPPRPRLVAVAAGGSRQRLIAMTRAWVTRRVLMFEARNSGANSFRNEFNCQHQVHPVEPGSSG